MSSSTVSPLQPLSAAARAPAGVGLASPARLGALRDFIEHEADLLDQQRFSDWYELFAEDGVYWVPAERGQVDPLGHVSIFYDDKTILRTRVARLGHEMIHCQDPASACVRVLSSFRIDAAASQPEAGLVAVSSKFVMLEDRAGAPRRFYGGRLLHLLRESDAGLSIVLKRVDLTNCDQSFPALSQPF